MNRSRLIFLTVFIFISFAGSVTTAQTLDPARDFLFIGIDPKTLNGGRNADIYLIRSDGSRVTNLTNTEFDSENHAYWSADSTKIYFSRNSMAVYPGSTEEQSSTSFYVMDISDEGKNAGERLLFHLNDVMGIPMRVEDWVLSPDDRTLVFIPNNESLAGTILVNADGTNQREVLAKGLATTFVPLQWSPDSTEFAYIAESCNAPLTNLCPYWVAQRAGDKPPQLIGSHTELMKRWHPADTFLGYDYPNFTVQRGDKVILHDQQFTPALAPDGGLLAYTTHNDANHTSQLVTYDLDTGQPGRILTSEIKGIISYVHWSPDSTQIAFVTTLTNGHEAVVYVVSADGTGQKELLRREIWSDDTLAWQPDVQSKDG